MEDMTLALASAVAEETKLRIRWQRRALRAERKLEKLRRKEALRRWKASPDRRMVRTWRVAPSAWVTDEWADHISAVRTLEQAGWHRARGNKRDARWSLDNARKLTLQAPPGRGIPLPRNDVHAGQRYNRS
jgi:hypothetical protein